MVVPLNLSSLMPRLKKRIQKQDLANIRTWINDSNPFSDYFRLTQVPEVLPGGKSGFLINGSTNLIRTTEVLVEIVDADGNTIFCQPIKNYQEGLARVVSIEVYDDTPPGPAILTILGELRYDKNGNQAPPEWQGTYNVKWQKIINVEPTRPNINQIRLYNKPVLEVHEHLIPFRQTITGSMISISSGTLTGQYVAPNVQLMGNQRIITKQGTLITCDQPIFVKQAQQGTLYAVVNSIPFTSSIEFIQNNTTAKFDNYVSSSLTAPIQRWTTSNYTMSYSQSSSYVTSSLNRSFADIKLTNLTTFTGDIQRAKFYIRGVDENQAYELLEDVILESSELTTTSSITTGEIVQLGRLLDQSFINTYWEAGDIAGLSYVTTQSVVPTYESTVLIDSVYLSGNTGSTYLSASTTPVNWFGIVSPLDVYQTTEYTFRANIVCIKGDPNFDAQLDIILSGSNLCSGLGNALGYQIARLTVPSGQIRNRYQNYSVNFTLPFDDVANLRFVIYGGEWHISDVEIISARETGFNPDEIHIYAPVVGRRFERLQFKAELYDANSNLVPLLIETNPIYFDGGNLVVRGSDNRIDGILTVAPSGSGPLLTTRGFYNNTSVFVEGQAIAIGPSIPYVNNKNTAFFAGTSSAGPEISIGDKLYGYYDVPTDQFVLQIQGTILIGSGSNFIDIRNFLRRSPSNLILDSVFADYGDFYDVRASNSVNAGTWNGQIGRLGNYTRGYDGFNQQPTLSLASVSTSIPSPTGSGTFTFIVTSGTLTIPSSSYMIWNETIYANSLIDITQFTTPSGTIIADYQLEVLTSWVAYPNPTGSGQRIISENPLYITTASNYSPAAIVDYPIWIPQNRTGDTLYIVAKLSLNITPST